MPRYMAMLDPHSADDLDLNQIWNLVDDLIDRSQTRAALPVSSAGAGAYLTDD